MIVRNVIINSFCPHKIREELTARIKFCTNNHFYEKVFLLLSLLLKYIEICKNILRDDTTRKIKYLTLFFFFFTFDRLPRKVSRTLSINILHSRQIFVHLARNLENSNFLGILKKRNRAFFLLHWRATYETEGKMFHKFYKYNAASKWMRKHKINYCHDKKFVVTFERISYVYKKYTYTA